MNHIPDPDEFDVLVAHSVSAVVGEDGHLFIHFHDEDGSIFALGILDTSTGLQLCKQIGDALRLAKCEGTA
jgi:hypothetical protein